MAEQRRSAIGNERVGARLGRLFQRNRTQEERDVLEAYRRQVPVDEIRRQREMGSRSRMGGESSSMAESAQAGLEAVEARDVSRAAEAAANEVRAAAAARNAARTQRRPNTRMTPSAAPREMTADELNALSMGRGEGSDSEAAANIRRRLAEMEAGMKKGGVVKKMAKGGAVKMAVGGASKRADGCAMRGKTKGRMV